MFIISYIPILEIILPIMNDNFSILFKNTHTDKLKIELQMVDLNRNDSIGFRILNPYKNNIFRIKYLEYLSGK